MLNISNVFISLKLLERNTNKTVRDLWTPTLAFYAHYNFESIKDTIQSMAKIMLKTSRASETDKLMSIRKKYANKKFGKIAAHSGN